MPQIELKFCLSLFVKLCWNPCVFGPQLWIRFWVCTMISLLKKPLSLSVWQSGWREIWNIFPAICCVCWWPRQGDQCCFRDVITWWSVSLIFFSVLCFFLFSSGSCTCKRYMSISSRQRRQLFIIGFLYREGFLYSSGTRGGPGRIPHF